MTRLNWDKIVHDTYVELYKLAEPPADFNDLLENATINERGEKEIPFDDYEISDKLLVSTIEKFIRKYKMNEINKRMYTTEIYLGVSPKTKIE